MRAAVLTLGGLTDIRPLACPALQFFINQEGDGMAKSCDGSWGCGDETSRCKAHSPIQAHQVVSLIYSNRTTSALHLQSKKLSLWAEANVFEPFSSIWTSLWHSICPENGCWLASSSNTRATSAPKLPIAFALGRPAEHAGKPLEFQQAL